ncbi:uncharacterized protein SOCE836_057790 [Sorangium cellulosum]|uniref:Uncharacterized protein n=1 Tax=Sorangium cellulosum TaxID=56 RepID=A0A4P2QTZ0_SORCE|nr:uncharacterized protein SOCE836_057790 [Sorangium cellulosum]
MTIKGLVVHFRRDLDDHEAERTIDALLMIKPVGSGCHALGGCSGAPGAAAGGGVAAAAGVGAAGSSSPVSGFTSAIARRERRYCPMASSC